MSVPAEVEASASGSAWVSDLALRDEALELAGALSFSDSWLVVLRISLVSDVGEVSRASFTNCFTKIRQ